MSNSNFEEEMSREIEKRVEYYESNVDLKNGLSKGNYILAFTFALLGLVLTIIAAI